MAIICPTVTAFDPHDYREQIERLQPFAKRIHIDLMDGDFTPTQSPPLGQIWLPDNITTDIHLMYQHPMNYLDQLVKLKPHMVIIHAESDFEASHFAAQLHEQGIKAGLALLQPTTVESVAELLSNFDHILVFSGDLGYHGGEADLKLLDKVQQLRVIKSDLEISWDGGINADNARQLIQGGVDVLNVGGFIQQANDPQAAYRQLADLLN